MATQISQKEALKRWKQLCETIQNFSTVNTAETKAEQMERISRARKDYAYFVENDYPHLHVTFVPYIRCSKDGL